MSSYPLNTKNSKLLSFGNITGLYETLLKPLIFGFEN